MRRLVVALALFVAAPAAAESPLFASEQPLRLTIQGPVTAMAGRSDQARDALLTVQGATAERLPIRLSPRGLTRRNPDICDFPPLRVQFAPAPPAGSVFAGQKGLKLVTHCRNAASFQQHVLLEYASYKLYNALTPASFKVRLANIDYVQPNGRLVATRVGFFIEDLDDVAARNGGTAPSFGPRVAMTSLSASDAARVALFQYLVGNLDWSSRAGPENDECCHNTKLFRAASGPLVPVPYDFDYTGLVDAPYAVPPDGLNIRSVRTRRYRGFCAHNPQALAAARALRGRNPELQRVIASIPQLDAGKRKRAAAYVEDFFKDIADDSTVTRKLFRDCIN